MKKAQSNRHSRNEYGAKWSVAAALLSGPKTLSQLVEYYKIIGRRFGFFMEPFHIHGKNRPFTDMKEFLKQSLSEMERNSLILQQGVYYSVTETGKKEAEKMLGELKKSGHVMEKLTAPKNVSRVTLVVHLVLGIIKLPAALISGSVGLLNDALDTLLDGLSSLVVFFGIKCNKERLSSFVLLIFMGVTGLYSFYEAVSRFFHPHEAAPEPLAFAAITISGAVCGLLYFYQKFAGLNHKSLPLITQSIDSRNHVFVAFGVIAALISSALNVPIIDIIVGIIVAVLILKGAVELLIEMIRSSNEEEIDLSKFGFTAFRKHQKKQFIQWILFEIEKGKFSSKKDIENEAKAAVDFSKIESFKALGIDNNEKSWQLAEQAVKEIFSQGLVYEETLRLTEKGRKELKR